MPKKKITTIYPWADSAMPYTLEELQSCKQINFDGKPHARGYTTVKKDYQALCDWSADVNSLKKCGNPVLYYYQFYNLFKCKREDGDKRKDIPGCGNIEEIYKSGPENIEILWQWTKIRNRNKGLLPRPIDVYEAFRRNTGPLVMFKASTAKYIYKKFNSQSVLDPTAGWGGRLLGASSLGIKYTGIDSNINLKEGYDKMIKDLNIENCNMIWKSCLEVDYSKINYDLVLTSPPYINLELYENMPKFQSDVLFYTEFLVPMMNEVYKHLQTGGHMCINISPKMYKHLIKSGYYRECDSNIDLKQNSSTTKDLIYVWNK